MALRKEKDQLGERDVPAGELLKEFASAPRQPLREFLEQKLGKELVDTVLSPARLTALGYDDAK